MKTNIYTLREGKLTHNGEAENIRREPTIYLFCFDEPLAKTDILNLFDLVDARIEVYVSYKYDSDSKVTIPEYYTYEIFV